MYYGMILLSVAMFGARFAINDVYRRMRRSSLRASLQFSLISSIAGLLALLVINGLRWEFTLFTLLLALAAALVGMGFTFCGFRALGTIDLSLYSLFSMLGGMLLPFLQGILFYGEPMTVAKTSCLALICIALALTFERKEKKRSGTIYYIGIFLLNGMSGVLSKLFASSQFEKTSAAGYSILIAVCSILLSAVLLIPLRKHKADDPPLNFKSVGLMTAAGGLNRVANFILVVALAHIDASVQYPMVTGGVMIASTLICFFGERKPSGRELLAVLLAFLGMLALFVIKF